MSGQSTQTRTGVLSKPGFLFGGPKFFMFANNPKPLNAKIFMCGFGAGLPGMPYNISRRLSLIILALRLPCEPCINPLVPCFVCLILQSSNYFAISMIDLLTVGMHAASRPS